MSPTRTETKSYQSRPVTRPFHRRQRTAGILAASMSGGENTLTNNEVGLPLNRGSFICIHTTR